MNEYDYNKYSGNRTRKRRKKRSKKEKAGFYIAFAICLVAVGMAVYSTYTGVTKYLTEDTTETQPALTENITAPVNNVVTGVTESGTEATAKSSMVISETSAATEPATDPSETEPTQDALQTMLSVSDSLSFPLSHINVQKPYSEDAVYNKTLNDWRAHPAIDLTAEAGESVYAMAGGTVEDLYDDNFLGKVVSVKTDSYTIFYCGLSNDVKVEKGQEVKTGDVLATAGTVPYEAMDKNHIHIEIKVDGKYIDPLSVIKNNE